MGDVTDDAKNPRHPDPDLEPVDDLGGIDVPDAPEDLDLPDLPDADAAADAADAGDDAGTDSTDTPPAARPARPAARDIYEMTGRARPQRIVPRPEDASGKKSDRDTDRDTAREPEPAADDTRTTVFDPVSRAEPADDETREIHPDEFSGTAVPAGDDEAATRVFDPVPADRPAEDDAFAPGAETAVLGAPAGPAGAAGAAGAYGAYGNGAPEDVEETADLTDEVRRGRPGGYPEDGEDVPATPRGTLDLGLLVLRVIVGVLLILRGAQTLFGFGGDPGIDILEDRLAAFTAPDVLAVAVPVAEIVGGGLLLLGLLTPLGGAVAVASAGFMGLFELSQSGVGYWPYEMSKDVQVWALLGLLGLVLVFTGPGRYSADTGRGWATRPRISAWLWAVIGLAGGAALWVLTGGGNPL